jgi:hypothetical protein
MRVRVLAIPAVLVLGVGALFVVTTESPDSEDSADIDRVQRDMGRLRTELRALRGSVQGMNTRTSHVTVQQAPPQAAPQAGASDEQLQELNEPDPLHDIVTPEDLEAHREELALQREEIRQNIDEAFAAERADGPWRRDTEGTLMDSLAANVQDVDYSVKNLECRSTMCRMQLEVGESNPQELMENIAGKPGFDMAGMVQLEPNDQGGTDVHLFLARDVEDFPDFRSS